MSNYFPTVWRSDVCEQMVSAGLVSRPCSLACRRPPSPWSLTGSSLWVCLCPPNCLCFCQVTLPGAKVTTTRASHLNVSGESWARTLGSLLAS